MIRDLIKKEGGIVNKSILDNIWKNETAEKYLKMIQQIEEPAEPSVPQPDWSILSHKAVEKFNEAMSMGEYLTPNVKSLFFCVAARSECSNKRVIIIDDGDLSLVTV